MQDISGRFPKWLQENEGKISREDARQHRAQLGHINAICKLLEDYGDSKFEELLKLLQEVRMLHVHAAHAYIRMHTEHACYIYTKHAAHACFACTLSGGGMFLQLQSMGQPPQELLAQMQAASGSGGDSNSALGALGGQQCPLQ
jgi:Pex19 protein family